MPAGERAENRAFVDDALSRAGIDLWGAAGNVPAMTLAPALPTAISLMARWLDLDQDGDLDLYVVNYCAAEHADKAFLADKAPPPGLANTVYRNDGQPEPIPGSPAPAWAPLAVAWENAKSKSGLSLASLHAAGMMAATVDALRRASGAPVAKASLLDKSAPGRLAAIFAGIALRVGAAAAISFPVGDGGPPRPIPLRPLRLPMASDSAGGEGAGAAGATARVGAGGSPATWRPICTKRSLSSVASFLSEAASRPKTGLRLRAIPCAAYACSLSSARKLVNGVIRP